MSVRVADPNCGPMSLARSGQLRPEPASQGVAHRDGGRLLLAHRHTQQGSPPPGIRSPGSVHHRGIGRHRRDVRDLVARPVAALPVLQGPSPSSAAQQAPPSEPRRRSMSLRNGSRLSGSKFSGWASIQAIVRSQYSIASSVSPRTSQTIALRINQSCTSG